MSCSERPWRQPWRRPPLLSPAALLVMLAATASHAAELPTMELSIKGHRLVAEVAATEPARTQGLMYRFSLQPDHGMLFVFAQPQVQAFWMKNTYVPLSIAFIDAEGRILNIEDMAPQTETAHLSRGAALYALEMKKGWFLQRGISPGDRVEGVERARKAKEIGMSCSHASLVALCARHIGGSATGPNLVFVTLNRLALIRPEPSHQSTLSKAAHDEC